MKELNTFDYYGWDVDEDDQLYKNLKLINRNMTNEEEVLYKQICDKFISKKRTALHIGSHYGFITKTLSTIFNEVHAFDFDNKIHEFMKHNFKKFNLHNIIVHSYGLGNENKKVDNSDFIPSKKNYGPLSNHVVENINGKQFVRKLDDLQIQNIDFILIDTEGYELNVLKGAFDSIKKFKPVIIIEIHKFKEMTKRYGYDKEENIKYLQNLGYNLKGYINNQDVLFIPE